MEFIEEYNGTKIYKEFGMFTTSAKGGHISDINFLKHLINLKNKREKENKKQ
jgi:hypothetical protein